MVALDDGTRLRCALSTVGREMEPQWMIIDADGRQLAGPLATNDRTADGVRRQIQEWWKREHGGEGGST